LPSSYDIRKNLRVVLTSVTEAEDKPLKYPKIFNTADVSVITKMDLAAAVDFDLSLAFANIDLVRYGSRVVNRVRENRFGNEQLARTPGAVLQPCCSPHRVYSP
jgi:hydrogenase nickel incorporation protein HypB